MNDSDRIEDTDGESNHDDSNEREPAAPLWSTRKEVRAFIELLGATSLGIAQYVLSVFGADVATFVAVRSRAMDVIAFALLVVFIPPVVLWAIERTMGFISDRLRRWIHYGFVGVLVFMFASRFFEPPMGPIEVVVVAAIAFGATWLIARTEPAAQFLRYLAFSPILFVVIFLWFTPLRSVVFASQTAPTAQVEMDRTPPVVVVVLDELPLGSLLDGHGQIDSEAFPALAKLSQHSTFARNNTTTATLTPLAVPAILSGKLPTSPDTAPNAPKHPHNLFTLLGDRYDLNASEFVTHLCPAPECNVPRDTIPRGFGPVKLLLHQVITLFRSDGIQFNISLGEPEPKAAADWLAAQPAYRDGRPTVRYLHLNLPHQPWDHLPDGRTYPAPTNPVRGRDAASDVSSTEVARQRHLLQVAYADHLVGELIASLEEQGTYDESLIIITSDHGVSFKPDHALRLIADDNVDDIAWTLLLVKEPGQREQRLIDSPTSSIDILPTVVDLLGVETDWEFDGSSIFGEPRPADWTPHVLPWTQDLVEPTEDGLTPIDGRAGYEEVIRRRALDADPGEDLRFWRWGDHAALIGEEAGSFDVGEPTEVTFSLDEPARFEGVDVSADSLPLYVSGRLDGRVDGPVAIAVNGVIGAWYDTSVGPGDPDSKLFMAVVPPSLFTDGDNQITLYSITGEGPHTELSEIRQAD